MRNPQVWWEFRNFFGESFGNPENLWNPGNPMGTLGIFGIPGIRNPPFPP